MTYEKLHARTTLKQVLELGKDCKKSGHCLSFSSGHATENDITNNALKLERTEAEVKEKYFEENTRFNTKMKKLKLVRQSPRAV